MTKLSYQELSEHLSEIINCNAFELHTESLANGQQNFYIPYMMNDALEYYLLLTNGRMTGEYIADSIAPLRVEFIESSARPALIFHQGNENVFTLWFEATYKDLKLYRYDQIGHFWVKGEEYWRQLVYIIGTIYDKYEYLGASVCNPEELSLLPLMEFAPFRYYTPIHESLDSYYSNTRAGLECMQALAQEANDLSFYHLTRLYAQFPFKWTAKLLAKTLNRPKRQALYELLYQKVQIASMQYPERTYTSELNQRIANERQQLTNQLRNKGFSGEYPRFHKSHIQILATEEHPFTILESDTFNFKIQLTVSEKTGNPAKPNLGFFRGKVIADSALDTI